MLIGLIIGALLLCIGFGYYHVKRMLPTWFKGLLISSLANLDKRYKTFYYDNTKLQHTEQLETNVDFLVVSQFGVFVIKHSISGNAGFCLIMVYHEDPSFGTDPKNFAVMPTVDVAKFINSHRSLVLGEKDVNTLASALLHEALPLVT
jgi:hypothetical protein